MSVVLQTHGLSKRYKRQMAVDGVDMTIEQGDIYGFVGENGSGKTTVIRLITGLIFPTDGGFELFGTSHRSRQIGNARRMLGAVVEAPSIYQNLSAYDNLKMQCTILGETDERMIVQTLEEVGLIDLLHEKKHASEFSLGMRQRLGIAMALLGRPRFLILDEPMNGLDPAGIVGMRELILKLNREQGITFLISSHILTELSLVATKYGIISKGKLIKEITAAELHRVCGKTTTITAADAVLLEQVLSQQLPDHAVMYSADTAQIAGEIDLNAVLKALLDADVGLLSVNCTESSFEEYYLSLIGGGDRA